MTECIGTVSADCRIYLYKDSKGSRHEYLIIEFLHYNGKKKLYLCLERGPGDGNDRNHEGKYAGSPLLPSAHFFLPGPRQSSETSLPLESGSARAVQKKSSIISPFRLPKTNISTPSSSSPSSSGRSLPNSIPSKGVDTEDRFSTLRSPGARHHNDELLVTVTFDTPPDTTPSSSSPHSRTGPYLYQVAVLAKVVHEMYPTYTITGYNCYFFANVVLKCLQELYVAASVVPVIKSEPILCGLLKHESSAGSCSRLAICDPEKLVTTDIKLAFSQALERFERPVSFYSVLATIRYNLTSFNIHTGRIM